MYAKQKLNKILNIMVTFVLVCFVCDVDVSSYVLTSHSLYTIGVFDSMSVVLKLYCCF
jgi:hypothetical protein